jgi:hypothetical protein
MDNRFRPAVGAIGQLLFGTAALGLLAFAPPAQGRMTIVSLSGQSADEIARWAIDGGAVLVATGTDSLTVEGARAALMPRALANGGILLAARADACGEGRPA